VRAVHLRQGSINHAVACAAKKGSRWRLSPDRSSAG
jgi:hypothetical protein